MIIDLILDRKDGEKYSAKKFYNEVMEYESVLNLNRRISMSMDYGTEKDVKQTLCDYIIDNGYNPDICNYINSVSWLETGLTVKQTPFGIMVDII